MKAISPTTVPGPAVRSRMRSPARPVHQNRERAAAHDEDVVRHVALADQGLAGGKAAALGEALQRFGWEWSWGSGAIGVAFGEALAGLASVAVSSVSRARSRSAAIFSDGPPAQLVPPASTACASSPAGLSTTWKACCSASSTILRKLCQPELSTPLTRLKSRITACSGSAPGPGARARTDDTRPGGRAEEQEAADLHNGPVALGAQPVRRRRGAPHG